MKKQFSYSRPSMMYVGYAATILIFLVIVVLTSSEGRLTAKLFMISVTPFLLFVLMEKMVFQKFQVTLTEEAIEIKKGLFGFDKIKYTEIKSVEKDAFTSNLIIKSGLNGYLRTIIPKLRISKEDINMIHDELNNKI